MVMDFVEANPLLAAIGTGILAAVIFALMKLMSGSSQKARVGLEPTQFQTFKLIKRSVISDDTRVFRFALHSPDQTLGLPIGQHMYLKATVDGAEVQRAYTPISSDNEKGYFDLLIKVYFKNVHPKFPEGGKLTQHLEAMAIGDGILVKGPTGRFEYTGNGTIVTKAGRDRTSQKHVKQIGMIAGGSGITPMFQILKAILKEANDRTEVHLLFANQTEEDILLRHELDQCAKDPRVKVWYTVDRPTAAWKFSSGFIDETMLRSHMPVASEDSVVLMCGPPPMINFACKPNLEKLGYTADQMFTF